MENNCLFVQILGYIFYGQTKCKMRRSFLGLTASKSALGIDPPIRVLTCPNFKTVNCFLSKQLHFTDYNCNIPTVN
jgi:hypothetical protein